MSAKKNPVSTPLHLLQHLSHSLLEHLENACSEALVDAEKMLAKLEKQRGKGQDLLHSNSSPRKPHASRSCPPSRLTPRRGRRPQRSNRAGRQGAS